jgi:uncharacterized protein with GYD domain
LQIQFAKLQENNNKKIFVKTHSLYNLQESMGGKETKLLSTIGEFDVQPKIYMGFH